jgi:hypothetical protein
VVRLHPPGGPLATLLRQAEHMKSHPVELDFRTNGQMDVTLLWDRVDDTIVVQVLDWATSQLFTVRPPRDRALDAFRHPFAYGEVGDDGVVGA